MAKVLIKNKQREIDREKCLKYLTSIRESVKKRGSPFNGMTEEEVIEELRKTREKLWEEKIANSL